MKSASLEIKTGGKKTADSAKRALTYALTVFFSFCATGAKVLSALSPFGLAAMAALPSNLSFLAFFGSMAGCLVFGGITDNLSYLIGLLVMLALKFLLSSFPKLKNNLGLLSVLSGLVMLATGLVTAYTISLSPAGTALKVAEAFLCAAMTYFMGTAYRLFTSKKPLSTATVPELASSAIVLSVLLLSLFPLSIGFVSVGRTAGALICLVFAYSYGLTGGAVGGVIAALCATLYDPDMAAAAGILITASFLSGLFKPLGKFAQLAAFVVTHAAGILIVGAGETALLQMVDVFAATVLFMAVPERFLSRIAITFQSERALNASDDPGKTIASKLQFASKTLSDLKDSVETVSEKMDQISGANISSVYDKTADMVCRRCGLNMFCWETAYNDTMNAFHSATPILRQKGKLEKNDVPAHFQNKCCKLSELTSTINHNYQTFLAKEKAMRRVSDSRSVAIEQFNGIANMLCEISSEISDVAKYDDRAAHKAREILTVLGLHPAEICCLIDKFGRMGLEVYLDEPLRVDIKIVADKVSDALSRDFDLPSVMTVDGRTKLAFFERANYTVDFSASQSANKGNKICGDSYEYFMDSKGFVHMILSDGMGSGGRAAIDSVMTCSLILKLIKAGFGFQAALKLINASLLVKSDDESLATLDVARLDLYTGKVEFLKAGSAASFVKRGGHVLQIDSGSLPIGILQNVEFDTSTLNIENGDVVVMVSDGVLMTGSKWIEGMIEHCEGKTARELADEILKEAKARSEDDRSDDLTVLVARIKRGV